MHARKLSQILTILSSTILHKSRRAAVISAVLPLLRGCQLTLTSLGRNVSGKANIKKRIDKINNLLSNRHLLRERINIYLALVHSLLGGRSQAVILVDWSPCGNSFYQILRASIVGDGRSITLYEEVHTDKELGKKRIEHKFLSRLHELIPRSCHCIIVTDAGFKSPWFKKVESLGWDWIGRIRNNVKFMNENGQWEETSNLRGRATAKITSLGKRLFTKSSPMEAYMFTLRSPSKKRVSKNKYGKKKKDGKSLRNAKSGREGWLIASSMDKKNFVINTYKKRMQIEQTFRDLKDTREGFALNNHGTKCTERLNIMLLLSTLAMFVLWLIGKAAERKELQYRFQANTIKHRRVLSLIYLAKQVIKHCPTVISIREIRQALNDFRFGGGLAV